MSAVVTPNLIALSEAVQDPRPSIYAGDADLAVTVDATWRALGLANDPPVLFCRGAEIVQVVEADGEPSLRSLSPYALLERMARAASWYQTRKRDGADVRVPARAPLEVARVLCATSAPELPPINRVIRTPIMAPSGRVLTAAGYDHETRVWYAPGGLALAPIPQKPTAAEIGAAVDLILLDFLGDFPFVSPADRANTLAFFLLPFARELIGGPTPLHLFDKPSPGSGATLLVGVIGIIVTGSPPRFMAEGTDEDEWRKRLTSTLMEGPEMIVIDNVRRGLDSAVLSQALTAPVMCDRILGASRNVALPVRCAWAATGNNPAVTSELARRSVPIRIDAKTDRPWERRPETFRHPKLPEWAAANRPRLVHAALTLLQAWAVAGRPEGQASLGSYEEWAGTMGGILDVVGVPGFMANRQRFYDRADREGATWAAFVGRWWANHGDTRVGAKELWPSVDELDPPFDLGKGNERSQRIRFGDILRAAVDRRFIVDNTTLQLEAAGILKNAAQYALVQVRTGECGECGESGTPHMRARARVITGGEHSPHSPDSPEGVAP